LPTPKKEASWREQKVKAEDDVDKLSITASLSQRCTVTVQLNMQSGFKPNRNPLSMKDIVNRFLNLKEDYNFEN
jgi:hypothetical protein